MAESGSVITITIGLNVYTGLSNGVGNYSIPVTPALADGTYTAVITARDSA